MESQTNAGAGETRTAIPEILIGLGLIAIAAVLAWQTAIMPVSPMYSKVGPTVFPYATAGALALFGVILTLRGFAGGWQDPEEKAVPNDWRSIGFVVAGLVANIVLIGPLGFTIASVAMFVLVAHGFGSRRPLRDALTGLIIAFAAYFGFARLLGVDIGGGLIERLFGV
ncbi:tripartite tricarboxylate transporter TctB family protein [Pseudomonas sp. R2.Fl]|nr:tripartite tricarboxylate transporter TctB family protein [Pseudomonas sp. R2.Fl]